MSRTSPVRLAASLGVVAAAAMLLAACGSATANTPSSAAAASGTSSTVTPADVSIALSWTPNTDYTGIYVADKLGYYKDAGITLKVLPYGSTSPETLVSKGAADFGFSYEAGVVYGRAAGLDLVSVLTPDQKGTYAIAVRADRADLATPKDLDGKIYAGFGSPDEVPELQTVIKNAGGTGNFTRVTLNTSAYQAVYAGKADFTISVKTWDGVEAGLVGKPVKFFELTDYGFPQQYSDLIVSSSKYLKANPDVAKRFLAATQKGFAYAADHPKEAAQLVIDANPGVFTNPQLVFDSEALLAKDNYRKDAKGGVGYQQADVWSQYGDFLFGHQLVTDSAGKVLAQKPDWSTYWTNDYLPAEQS